MWYSTTKLQSHNSMSIPAALHGGAAARRAHIVAAIWKLLRGCAALHYLEANLVHKTFSILFYI
jgi:hypothetical protein